MIGGCVPSCKRCCSLALTPNAFADAPPSPRKLITVVTADWAATTGELRRWQRDGKSVARRRRADRRSSSARAGSAAGAKARRRRRVAGAGASRSATPPATTTNRRARTSRIAWPRPSSAASTIPIARLQPRHQPRRRRREDAPRRRALSVHHLRAPQRRSACRAWAAASSCTCGSDAILTDGGLHGDGARRSAHAPRLGQSRYVARAIAARRIRERVSATGTCPSGSDASPAPTRADPSPRRWRRRSSC